MLDGVRVLVLGQRKAVTLSATLLERAGAKITHARREPVGSLSYDVVVTSSDLQCSQHERVIEKLKATGTCIVCDITAMGPQGARAAGSWSDAQIQAISGLMDTTGFAHGEPVRIGVPFTEISAALYAATAIGAALRVRRERGIAQDINVTLFGCAASALTTFLPAAFAQKKVGRVGNRHPACAPWNAYRASDGWILICTSTEEQWQKVKSLAGVPQLDAPQFATARDRVRNVEALDALIGSWTATLTSTECSDLCERIGVAAGPIVSASDLCLEANFRFRHMQAARLIEADGIDDQTYRQISIFDTSELTSAAVHPTATDQRVNPADTPQAAGPLAGVRVVEIGQYTTAPLVGKHLAALGAKVVKVEPPDGEVARSWTPGQGGTSYFFALNNTDKESIALDLKQPADQTYLRALVADADVLIENLRPGALAKLGFGREQLAETNPRLIYCSISGFGLRSAYPARPAFDTVIQAMGGLMDLTRSNGEPVKLGASGADILGGQAALFAIVSRLAKPGRDAGTFVEISMQDVAAWCALFAAGNSEGTGLVVSCRDGHAWLEGEQGSDTVALAESAQRSNCGALTRQAALAALAATGINAVPVVRVDELIEDGDFLADMLSVARDSSGTFWPVLKVPYRFSHTPARVRVVPGAPADKTAGARWVEL